MKSKATLILMLLTFSCVFFACNSSKAVNAGLVDLINNIKLEKITRGNNLMLDVSKNETLQTEMQLGGGADAVKGETSKDDWNQINQLVAQLDLSQIDQWEAPTQARFHDGARATTIIIESNGQTYSSQSFDEGKPPAALQSLYNYLESLVNQ